MEGTIFLDEVGELPASSQARLLRVLENGEFIKVGSSQVQKTDVRIIAATNRDLLERARESKFREDLYYRLATVTIAVPKLSERKGDIYLLFRKFATDFAEQYKTSLVQLDEEAQQVLANYPWPGNIRQLKNVTEQICVLEQTPLITKEILLRHLPKVNKNLPVLFSGRGSEDMSERDIYYKVLYDLKKDVNDLKQVVFGMLSTNNDSSFKQPGHDVAIKQAELRILNDSPNIEEQPVSSLPDVHYQSPSEDAQEHITIDSDDHVQYDENFSLEQQEINMIKKALLRHNGRRKEGLLKIWVFRNELCTEKLSNMNWIKSFALIFLTTLYGCGGVNYSLSGIKHSARG